MSTPAVPAAGVHLPWAQVPKTVREWAASVGGGAPTSVRDLAGGFSPGATVVLTCPDRAMFVKAVGAGLNPESPDFHRREAAISAAFPTAPQLPRLLEVHDDGDWVALAFDAIDGTPPACPWDPHEIRAAVARARGPARPPHSVPSAGGAIGGPAPEPTPRRLVGAGLPAVRTTRPG